MSYKRKTAFLYTLLHFLVDFTTIFFISSVLLGSSAKLVNNGSVLITYNLVAFAGQLPLGILADVIRKNRKVAAVGCILSGLAYPLSLFSPWAACISASLGNGAFHIGAGVDILEFSMPKAGLPGLFVSSGALGVWLALSVDSNIVSLLCPLIMLIAFIYLIATDKEVPEKENYVKIRYSKPDFFALSAVSCFMLTIVIRSLLGAIMNFSWKSVPVLSFAFVLAVVGGKAVGGYLGDRFGYIKTAVVSLLISLGAFVFAFDSPVAGIIAAFCFNMTMPLTLTAIASVSGRKYGFAFGLTTFALAIGLIPVIWWTSLHLGLPHLMGGTLLSLIFLTSGCLILKKRGI